MNRVLVIAAPTTGAAELLSRVRNLAEQSRADGRELHVTVVVPATHEPDTRPELAAAHVREFVDAIETLGVAVDGRVGPADPMRATDEVIQNSIYFDSILLTTTRLGLARWFHRDLSSRIERRYKLPVERVVGDPRSRPSAHGSPAAARTAFRQLAS